MVKVERYQVLAINTCNSTTEVLDTFDNEDDAIVYAQACREEDMKFPALPLFYEYSIRQIIE